MISLAEALTLLAIATIGHLMAAVWYVAAARKWSVTATAIYDLSVKPAQLKRELLNSIHTPLHAVILLAFLMLGCFANRSAISFFGTLVATTVWAEIWHYASHRAFHLRQLHWIHAEHHKSRINTPLTALSFSLTEKLIFDLGLVGALALVGLLAPLNFFGICAWYIGYLVINSFSHANFEFKSSKYLQRAGRMLTCTTYHSLHHARYKGNYGLGTRFLDRAFGTEWTDYEQLYARVTSDRRPLTSLGEVVEGVRHGVVLSEATK
jgi:Delta7-sterol 5-desaturase